MRLLRTTLFLAVCILISATASPSLAQIWVNEDGSVSVTGEPTIRTKFGVMADGDSTSERSIQGVYGFAENAVNPHGVMGGARWGEGRNYGVYGFAYEGPINYGVRGESYIYSDENTGYGIYGTNPNGGGYAGYFDGDLAYTGNLTNVSDRKFKRDVRGLGRSLSGEVAERVRANARGAGGARGPNAALAGADAPARSAARAKLLQLQPQAYRFEREAHSQMSFPEGKQFGLVAQEVEEIFPELVNEEVHPGQEERDREGRLISAGKPTRYKSVNYMQLIPIMIQTIREQQAELDTLRDRVRELEQ